MLNEPAASAQSHPNRKYPEGVGKVSRPHRNLALSQLKHSSLHFRTEQKANLKSSTGLFGHSWQGSPGKTDKFCRSELISFIPFLPSGATETHQQGDITGLS